MDGYCLVTDCDKLALRHGGTEANVRVSGRIIRAGGQKSTRELRKIKTITQIDTCRRWLEQYLGERGGEAKASDVYAVAKTLGFSTGTLHRAATALGVESERDQCWTPGATWRLGGAA